MKEVHIFAQGAWHEEAYIVGEKESLKLLRDTLTRAIDAEDGMSSQELSTNDGEGYDVHVVSLSKEAMNKMGLPYTAEVALDERETATWPWMFYKDLKAKREKEGFKR